MYRIKQISKNTFRLIRLIKKGLKRHCYHTASHSPSFSQRRGIRKKGPIHTTACTKRLSADPLVETTRKQQQQHHHSQECPRYCRDEETSSLCHGAVALLEIRCYQSLLNVWFTGSQPAPGVTSAQTCASECWYQCFLRRPIWMDFLKTSIYYAKRYQASRSHVHRTYTRVPIWEETFYSQKKKSPFLFLNASYFLPQNQVWLWVKK